MYDPSVLWPVLRLLEHWGRLPLSDVERMLDPLTRPRFRRSLIEDLRHDGDISLEMVGDEWVLELTPQGRSRLTPRGPASQPSRED